MAACALPFLVLDIRVRESSQCSSNRLDRNTQACQQHPPVFVEWVRKSVIWFPKPQPGVPRVSSLLMKSVTPINVIIKYKRQLRGEGKHVVISEYDGQECFSELQQSMALRWSRPHLFVHADSDGKQRWTCISAPTKPFRI